jgi:hypothetical protein
MTLKRPTAKYTGNFFVGEVDGIGFLAATKVDGNGPFFCIHAETEQEVVDKTLRALSFYVKYSEENKEVHFRVEKRLPFHSAQKTFVPREVIYATA